RQQAIATDGRVLRTDLHFTEAARPIDPRLVDLVAGVLTLELDMRANGQAVVERGLALEVDFRVVQEAVVVMAVAEMASLLAVENAAVNGLEETAYVELDPIGRLRGAGNHASAEEGR